jgi:hypothetical protein
MRIRVTCSACDHTFKVDGRFAGKKAYCPNADCRQVLRIPQAAVDVDELEEFSFSSSDLEDHDAEEAQPLPPVKGKSKGSGGSSSSRGSSRQAPPLPSRRKGAVVKRGGKSSSSSNSIIGVAVGGVAALVLALGAVAFLWPRPQGDGTPSSSGVAQAAEHSLPAYADHAAPFMKKYCIECHQGPDAEAGIAFDKYSDTASILKDRKQWERIMQIIDGRIMPPDDSPQPTDEERAKLVSFLDSTVYYVDCATNPDPGRVTVRRLNRTEYNNTVRDLLGVNLRPADDFPSDDVGYGFDNIGDVLSLPPLLMEKYLGAADKLSQAAIISIDPNDLPVKRWKGRELERSKVAHDHGSEEEGGIILVSTGDATIPVNVPLSGEYTLKIVAAETPAGTDRSKLAVKLDGQELKVFEVAANERKPETYSLPLTLMQGQRKVSLGFLNDFYDEKAKDPKRRDRNLIIVSAALVGPSKVLPGGYPAAHTNLVKVVPVQGEGAKSVGDAARENLAPFITRAFRRPAKDEEIAKYVSLVEQAVAAGEPFEFGMQVAVQAVLVSPHFLFRLESDNDPDNPKNAHIINAYELASRLSYFLWSTMPDEELFAHAKQGDLGNELILDDQVRRMLKDPRSTALVENFAEQWLQLRILDEITPDPKSFPNFNDDLRRDMKEETRQFIRTIVQEDRSVLDFLVGDYTFVNERLANHYGIKDVKGNDFRQVSLAGTNRAGVLTHASVLAITSNPTRTSPVKRGKWIMETILDSPPPAPPPNVPELEAKKDQAAGLSLRQQMEQHRSNPACASCHKTMDTLGFGLENFDAIGRFREQDGGQPLDTSGTLPGGDSFKGPLEMVNILKTKKQKAFTECLTEKLLTYALGRGLEYDDRCSVNRITGELSAQNFRFSVLVKEIVKSEPFRLRRGEGPIL